MAKYDEPAAHSLADRWSHLGLTNLANDNLVVPGQAGEKIAIRGRVLDGDANGVCDALIEIWQADAGGARGRFHHLTYFMDSREDVLRAVDILVESGAFIETGPHKHNIGRTFFLYFYEPGGNRCEVAAGGYLVLDPDWKPVVWTQEDRRKGQAWGLQTVGTFHTYGTPPVEPE